MDNIRLGNGEKLSFSYRMLYQSEDPIIKIEIEDFDYMPEKIKKDTYPDIKIQTTCPCEKNGRTLFNERKSNNRTYESVYRDVQGDIDTYNTKAQTEATSTLTDFVEELNEIDSISEMKSLPGLSNLE